MRKNERREELLDSAGGIHEEFMDAIPQNSEARAREAAMRLGKRTLEKIGPDLVSEYKEIDSEIRELRKRQKEIRELLEVAGIDLEDYMDK